MRRLGVFLGTVVVAALLIAPNTLAAGPSFYLDQAKADELMHVALGREFGNSFRHAYAKRVDCDRRLRVDRRRCSMSWVIGDMGFWGRGQIWITYPRHIPQWNFAFRVAELNEYCAATGGHHCLHWRTVR